MRDNTQPGALMMTWVSVVDERGIGHMEARWVVVPDASAMAPSSTTHLAPATHAVSAA